MLSLRGVKCHETVEGKHESHDETVFVRSPPPDMLLAARTAERNVRLERKIRLGCLVLKGLVGEAFGTPLPKHQERERQYREPGQ